MATNPRSESSGSRITCGANECYNLSIFECPLCKLEVCKKHKQHDIQYDSTQSVKAHSNIRRM